MSHRIAVLRGGPSSEYDVSLKSGRSVIDTLNNSDADYKIVDITIDKSGKWYKSGIEFSPIEALKEIDLVFNAMHGEFGEDGKVQQLLHSLNKPFTGPKALGAALAMHKAKAKEIYKEYGLKTPKYFVLDKSADIEKSALEIFRAMQMPVIIKPVGSGSSVGISIARDYESLVETLISLFVYSDKLLIEEYIEGKEGTVGVIEKFRNKNIYPLLPVEIIPPKEKDFFDYECKYDGSTEEICPGSFSREESEMMQEAAIKAHEALGLRHYSRTDFIVHPRRGIFVLETNSLPGLTSESLLPKSLEPIGSNYEEFLNHVINLALDEGRRHP
ncbi:D-alanine--D-alanine ligase [Candidatus Pacebacteria bacterium]|nr:D-alanine--D-alanine ligase [Candidatus Paceibacterota bacterium]